MHMAIGALRFEEGFATLCIAAGLYQRRIAIDHALTIRVWQPAGALEQLFCAARYFRVGMSRKRLLLIQRQVGNIQGTFFESLQ